MGKWGKTLRYTDQLCSYPLSHKLLPLPFLLCHDVLYSSLSGTKSASSLTASLYVCVHVCALCISVCVHKCICVHMCICVCTCVSVCMCICMRMCTNAHDCGGKGATSCIFLHSFFSLFLKQGFSMNLDLPSQHTPDTLRPCLPSAETAGLLCSTPPFWG